MSRVIYCDQDTKLIDGELVSNGIDGVCECPKHTNWKPSIVSSRNIKNAEVIKFYLDKKEFSEFLDAVDHVVATFRGPLFNKVQDEDLRNKLVALRNTREKFF